MANTNKTQEVLQYLKDHPKTGITSLEAINKFGATRLSAIIFNLRKRYVIQDLQKETVDRYGHTCRFVRYVLVGERKAK